MTSCEVAVYGATSAGVCAAVAAATQGASTVLIEPGRHLGGMTSGGLGYTDLGDVRVLGGPAARFRADVAEHYGVEVGRFAGPEPHVAELIFERWLDQAGVTVVLDGALDAVGVDSGRISSIRLVDGRTVTAGIWVDASYEGDLMAGAGVPYAVGREDVGLYAETLAGRQELMPGRHSFPPGISPFVDDPSGFEQGPLLPGIRSEPLAPVGVGDGGVMSYGYRVCLTRSADRIELARRDGYDPDAFELARRLLASYRRAGVQVTAGQLIGLEQNLPGDKCDANSLGPFSLSVLDGSAWDYPDADRAERDRIRLHHLHHAQDLLYFLSHDESVPAAVRTELLEWGLPRDEFADTGHLPHQLYVREARRMLGERVLTQHDLTDPRPAPDVVARGSYHIDIREVQRCWRWAWEHPDPVAHVFNEGYLSVAVPVYPIPYAVMLPRRQDATNLLVPVCLSASHVAFGSLRMEPQYQMLGHAAGLAAWLALEAGTPHDVAIDRLQALLRDSRQIG